MPGPEEVNGGHVYAFENKKYPSVTTIIHATLDPEDRKGLEDWENTFQMTGFKNAEDYRNYTSIRGTLVHYNVLNQLANSMIGVTLDASGLPVLSKWIDRSDRLMHEIQIMRTQWIKRGLMFYPPVEIETSMYHPILNYAGTPDLAANVKKIGTAIGSPEAIPVGTIVDLKTSKRPRASQRTQLGGYAQMLNFFQPGRIKQGMLIYLNPGFTSAKIVEIPEKELLEEIEIFNDHLERFWEIPGIKKEYGL